MSFSGLISERIQIESQLHDMKKLYTPTMVWNQENYQIQMGLLNQKKSLLENDILNFKIKLERAELQTTNKSSLNQLYEQVKSLEKNLDKNYSNVYEKIKLSHEKFLLFFNTKGTIEMDEENNEVFNQI